MSHDNAGDTLTDAVAEGEPVAAEDRLPAVKAATDRSEAANGDGDHHNSAEDVSNVEKEIKEHVKTEAAATASKDEGGRTVGVESDKDKGKSRRDDDDREDGRRKDKKRERSRSRDRDRHRDRRSRSRDRKRSRSRDKRKRERDRSRERDASRSRDRPRYDRDKERDRRRSRSRSRSHRRRSKSRDKKDRRRSRSRSRDRRRRRRRSSSSSDGTGGYRPRKRAEAPRDVGGFSTSYIDPFAALRTANVPTDPEELARQRVEQQLKARQLVLQQQAASAVAAASKTQREVYVGNLLAGVVTEDMLRQLFDTTMKAAFPDKIPPNMNPVVNVSMHSEGRYAFVELLTPDMATTALQLTGQVQLLGQAISVGRPSGYVDPAKAQAAAQQSAIALAQFQETRLKDTGVLCQEDGTANSPTAIMVVDAIVLPATLMDDVAYNELLAELKDECNKHGMVLRVYVPRPLDPSQTPAMWGQQQIGRAFVQFIDADAATNAKNVLHGRLFDGRTLQVSYIHPTFYLEIQGIKSDPAAT